MSVRRPARGLYALERGARARESEIANAELVSVVTVTASLTAATTSYVNHGMGRAYVGALVVCQDSGGGEARVMTPEAVTAAGNDPAVVVGMTFSSAFTGTVRLRVF